MQVATHVHHMPASYIREILAAASAPGVISLAGGLPDGQNFPLPLMASAIHALPLQPALFQYGLTAGYQPLLDHLVDVYELPSSHAAMICTGSQQGLDLVARTFLNKGDVVALEAPGYLGAIQVFGLAQARIEPIPQADDGPDLQALEDCFRQHSVKLFYAVPDFHNPSGVCWSLQTRQQVAQLCQRYQVALIEDSPYRELRFSGAALPMVSSFCVDQALVLRSFSKIATPGIRLGMLSGKQEWLAALIKVKQSADLHSNTPMQAVLLALLQHPQFGEHIETLRALYRGRYQAMATALQQYLPASCQFKPVAGGMFVWLTLPPCNDMAVAAACLERGVAVVPAAVFYPPGEPAHSGLRLNFSNTTAAQLELAIERLAAVLAQFL